MNMMIGRIAHVRNLQRTDCIESNFCCRLRFYDVQHLFLREISLTLFIVYLFLILPKIAEGIFFIGCGMAVFAAIVAFFSFAENKPVIFLKKTFISGIVLAICSVLIPNKQDSYILAGVYATQLAVESEVGQDVLQLVKNKIKESVENTKE